MSVSLSMRGSKKTLHLLQNQGSLRPFITIANGCISSIKIPNTTSQVRHGTSMKVILLENVANRGAKGEIVPVKRGYARNLLIPRKLAAYATLENKTKFEEIITQRRTNKESGIIEDGESVKFNLALEIVKKEVVESEVFAFVRATLADGSGLIAEAVTTADILSYLETGGYEVPSESDIVMPEITAVGLYPVNIGGVRAILHVIEAVVIKHD